MPAAGAAGQGQGGFIYGAGSRTLPKAGRLGSGAFFKAGHHPSIVGNVFGPNWDTRAVGAPTTGQEFSVNGVQALRSTTAFGRAPNDPTTQQFPRDTHWQTASYRKLTTLTHARGGVIGVAPITQAAGAQPHEQTTFVHGRVRILRPPYRPTGGVNNSLATDTAFNRNPPKRVAKAQPVPVRDTSKLYGSAETPAKVQAAGIGSFRVGQSSGSLHGNASNPVVNGNSIATNRWSTIKRGAAEGRGF